MRTIRFFLFVAAMSGAAWAGEKCPNGQEQVCDEAVCNSAKNDGSKPCDCSVIGTYPDPRPNACRNQRNEQACSLCCAKNKKCVPK